jgi:N-methylhydantoinase A
VPMVPGHFSAYGMLQADLRRDYRQTEVLLLDEVTPEAISDRFRRLEEEALAAFREDGLPGTQVVLLRRADMRYVGQEHTVSVPFPGGTLGAADLELLSERFHALHESLYTFRLPSRIEIVTFHLTALGALPKPTRAPLPAGSGDVERARKGARRIDFDELGEAEAQVYERSALAPGATLVGPAVVEEEAATTLVYPGMRLVVGAYGDLLLDTGVGGGEA